MFLHIGGSHVVFHSEIIGIFDISLLEDNPVNRQKDADQPRYKGPKKGFNRPKSFILTDNSIYLSPISAATLCKRDSTSN